MKGVIERHWFKIGILVVAVVLLVFANNYMHEQTALAADQAAEQKADKDRAYAADQKEACLGIYKQESSKWNNTDGWRYDANEDRCYVEYKESTPKTAAECDASYKGDDGKLIPALVIDWLLCTEGEFEKSF